MCLRCGEPTINKYCGSQRYKTGCAYLVLRERTKVTQKARYVARPKFTGKDYEDYLAEQTSRKFAEKVRHSPSFVNSSAYMKVVYGL